MAIKVNGKFVDGLRQAFVRAPVELVKGMAEVAEAAGYMLENNYQKSRAKDATYKLAMSKAQTPAAQKARKELGNDMMEFAKRGAFMSGGLTDVSVKGRVATDLMAKTVGELDELSDKTKDVVINSFKDNFGGKDLVNGKELRDWVFGLANKHPVAAAQLFTQPSVFNGTEPMTYMAENFARTMIDSVSRAVTNPASSTASDIFLKVLLTK